MYRDRVIYEKITGFTQALDVITTVSDLGFQSERGLRVSNSLACFGEFGGNTESK